MILDILFFHFFSPVETENVTLQFSKSEALADAAFFPRTGPNKKLQGHH